MPRGTTNQRGPASHSYLIALFTPLLLIEL